MMPQIINTWKCNFKCAHCMFSCSPQKKGFIEKREFMDFAKEFKGYEWINLVGGEPFEHPDILWQIEYLLWVFDNVRIATNGAWIVNNPELYEEFEQKFYGNTRICIMVSDDIYHEKFWPKGFTAKRALTLLSYSEITTEEDDRRNRYGNIMHIGRAAKNNLGDPGSNGFVECFEDGRHVFNPCLLPNGDIASCCNGRIVVGNIRTNSIKSCEERFLKIRSKMRKRPKEKDCHKCPRKIKLF